MATWPDLYNDFLRAIAKSADSTLQTDCTRFFNECSKKIQAVAGVQKTWSVTITASTESYTLAGANITDMWRPREARFLPTGTTDKLRNYQTWTVAQPYDDHGYDRRGNRTFYLAAGTIYVPAPPSVGGTLKIHGEKLLDAIASSALNDGGAGTPEIEDSYHDIYPWFAAREYGSQRQDYVADGRVRYFETRFQERLADLTGYYHRTQYRRARIQAPRWT